MACVVLDRLRLILQTSRVDDTTVFGVNLNPWDTAAGVLIVQEAGGTVTNMSGGPFHIDGAARRWPAMALFTKYSGRSSRKSSWRARPRASS